MILLLDTHVWVWCATGDVARVGRRTRQMVDLAEGRDELRVSPLSIFEVSSLHSIGRLRLATPPEQWIDDALAMPGLRIGEFSAAVAVDAGLLSRPELPDPVDRMLVATARALNATLLTADRRILRYAADTHALRVQDASR